MLGHIGLHFCENNNNNNNNTMHLIHIEKEPMVGYKSHHLPKKIRLNYEVEGFFFVLLNLGRKIECESYYYSLLTSVMI